VILIYEEFSLKCDKFTRIKFLGRVISIIQPNMQSHQLVGIRS